MPKNLLIVLASRHHFLKIQSKKFLLDKTKSSEEKWSELETETKELRNTSFITN